MNQNMLVGIVLAIASLWVIALALFWIFRPRGVAARDVVRLVPDVFRLLRSLIGDRSTPLDVRLVLIGLLAWILSPIDLIPEFVPGLGPIDDIVVAVIALRYTRKRLGVEDLRRLWRGSDDSLSLLLRIIGTS